MTCKHDARSSFSHENPGCCDFLFIKDQNVNECFHPDLPRAGILDPLDLNVAASGFAHSYISSLISAAFCSFSHPLFL
jgi:hypothetical protein